MTLDEFLALPPYPGWKVELYEGVVVVTELDDDHRRFVKRLANMLRLAGLSVEEQPSIMIPPSEEVTQEENVPQEENNVAG